MKVLAFAASSSSQSINRALVEHAMSRLGSEFLEDVTVELIDLRDYEMPIYSIDRENEGGIPQPARRFFEQIGAADGLAISYAEHNGLFTAAFKNLFDWASRIDMKVFQGKPVLALSTSVGGRGGANVLKTALQAAPHFGAQVVASMSVPRFGDNFDRDEGRLTDPALSESLGKSLAFFASRLSGAPGKKLPGGEAWNQRYADAQAAYGSEPNSFLKAVSGRIPPGPVLVIAAGEGRNAVYLAKRGYDVTAVDQSDVGLAHAASLAERGNVEIKTVVSDLAEYDFGEAKWAGIVSIWAHVPPELRARMHAACVRALQPGGVFVLEGYCRDHLTLPGRGGPPVPELLMDSAAVERELEGLAFELCQQTQRNISEGRDHEGPSATTQVLAVRR